MSSNLEALFRSAQLSMVRISHVDGQGNEVAAGSGFMTTSGLVTAHHVIADATLECLLRFEADQSVVSLDPGEVRKRLIYESPEDQRDYALVSLANLESPALPSNAQIEIEQVSTPPVGRQVGYLGYPFSTDVLTASTGYVSAHQAEEVLRLDGSVNRGNSGGPLFDAVAQKLVGIVVRAETGILQRQFENLERTLAQNVQLLSRGGPVIQVGGIDVMQGLRSSQAALQQLARTIRRQANVGIGFAESINHLARSL